VSQVRFLSGGQNRSVAKWSKAALSKSVFRGFESYLACKERWESGLIHQFAKLANKKLFRGFESPSFRKFKEYLQQTKMVANLKIVRCSIPQIVVKRLLSIPIFGGTSQLVVAAASKAVRS
jgi:hypothetical protein